MAEGCEHSTPAASAETASAHSSRQSVERGVGAATQQSATQAAIGAGRLGTGAVAVTAATDYIPMGAVSVEEGSGQVQLRLELFQGHLGARQLREVAFVGVRGTRAYALLPRGNLYGLLVAGKVREGFSAKREFVLFNPALLNPECFRKLQRIDTVAHLENGSIAAVPEGGLGICQGCDAWGWLDRMGQVSRHDDSRR